MEVFIDGGLIELGLMLALGVVINYIFLNKYILILYSALSLVSPFILLIFKDSELFYFALSLQMLNSILLVIFLWRLKKQNPEKALFDLSKFRK